MGLNLSNLETVLQSKVDGLTSSSTDKDVLLTSKSIEAATADVTVSDVITEGGTQVTAINSAASTKVGEVNTAGGTQVTAVNDAGTAQIALVNAIDTYTKTETDAKIVELAPAPDISGKLDKANGTMTGNLTITGSDAHLILADQTGTPTNQNIRLRHEPINSNNPNSEDNALWIEDTSGANLPCALVVQDDIYANGSKKVLTQNFDSGWISITAGNTYTVTHNLDTNVLLVTMLIRGASTHKIVYNADEPGIFILDRSNGYSGVALEEFTTNVCKIITGNTNIFSYDNTVQYGGAQFANGNKDTDGQVRVLLTKG